jgi:uridine phosphorylase
MSDRFPILDHPLADPTAFTPAALMEDVRRSRRLTNDSVPSVCILDFDGDLTDWLVRERMAMPFLSWACFHTSMFALELEDITCGIIARTIGGPYSVLMAEQLQAAGARLIVGLTSAGRVLPDLPLPCLVVATSAVRDEGTSYHYLPPAREVACSALIVSALERELKMTGQEVFCGKVWTTDAPYRETIAQLNNWAGEGVLAVEMQAASLFAFAIARQASVAYVALVSNAVDHAGEQFDTGSMLNGVVLRAIARASRTLLGNTVAGLCSGYGAKRGTPRDGVGQRI